jgi:hypothetical protein
MQHPLFNELHLKVALAGATACLGLLPAGALAESVTLSNREVVAAWTIEHQQLHPDFVQDLLTGQTIRLQGELFSLVLTNGAFVHASGFKLVGPVCMETLAANPGLSRFAERLPGRQAVAELVSADGNLQVTWRAILREGSRYLRQQIELKAEQAPVPLKDILLLDTPVPDATSTGTVEGSPVATKTAFFGVEHPLSVNRGEMGYVRCFLPRGTPLQVGESFACSSVIGFVLKGQLRRGFLAYLERERAHPYRPFLHYNSWYDIGYFSKYDEKAALGVIHAYGEELVKQRGVKLDSFLFDDGWDDYKTLWRLHEGFPNGFMPIQEAANAIGAAPGIWLSPWGGYGKPHDERIKYGREQGFEIRDGNFSMAGAKYYERFRSLCVEAVQKYGINQFKFDGIGVGTKDDPSAGLRDFEAMLRLIAELRALKPDLYINQTTGTWPSPFWLLHADSIWRGGEDHSFVQGTEPPRQRWITYRDNDIYDGIVSKSDLYPLNSLMLHGIIYAKHAEGLNADTNHVLKSEVRTYFGCGTQLQELYVTPSLLTAQDWDTLAEAAKWSRVNAETLLDTHWVGGSPGEHKVYGWASWSPRKGILTLRNPSSRSAEIKIDAAKVFELPEGSPQSYKLVSPFKDQDLQVSKLRAGEETPFKLKPFEVLVVEALPAE